MRFATIALLSSAAVATAQSTTSAATGTTECAAQNILDTCVEQIQVQIDKCEANDWICMCENYTNKLTCYNNCPDSLERPSVENQVTAFCNAAEPLKSASRASAASASTKSAKASKTAEDAEATPTKSGAKATKGTSGGTGKGSSTAKATAAVETGAAGVLAVPVGGVFAALLALL